MVPKRLVAVVLLVACFAGCGEVKPPPADGSGDVIGAWAMMQQFVEEQLKSPKSAEFPWSAKDQVTDLGGGRYAVDSYVDSENGFGANIRTHFKGVIRKQGEKWVLESLTFGDRPAPDPQQSPEPKPEPAPIEPEPETDPPTAEELAEKNEKAAAGKLRLAEQFLKRGETAKAKDWLEELVRDYPGTKAAAEAKAKLDSLD